MFKNRRQKLKLTSIFLAVAMLVGIPTFASAQSSKTSKKSVVAKSKTVKTIKIYVSGLESDYLSKQTANFKAWSTGDNKPVQYKVLLINQQSKKSLDLTKGYTKPYSYKTKFLYKLPRLSVGKYKAYIYVRRVGSRVSYDSYTIRNIVVSNTISLNKNGQVFGGKNVSTVNNDIIITGDKVTLNNLKINGSLIINPGEKGTTNLNNISVQNVQVLSGGQNSIHLNDVQITNKLTVQSNNVNNPVRIETTGNTEISYTQVGSDAILDSGEGSFGNIVIVNSSSNTNNVELRGNFNEKKIIAVTGNSCIKASTGTSIPNLIVTPENKDSQITLSGNFKNVDVNKEAKIEVTSGKIDKVVTNAKAEVNIDKDAKVDKVDVKGNDTKIGGEGSKGTIIDNKKDSNTNNNTTPSVDNPISFNVIGNKIQITPNKKPTQNLTIVIYEKGKNDTAKFIDQWNLNDGESKFTTELDAGSYDAYVSGIDGYGKIHFEFQVK